MLSSLDKNKILAELSATPPSLLKKSWLDGFGLESDRGAAKATINCDQVCAVIDRRLLGAFLEHLGRAVYTGIYEPDSQLADDQGFRTDVLEEVRSMQVPIIRYPGGNFVSGYNWLDGVGPRERRPTVLERAWNSLETNQFGTNEFMEWCKRVGTEPLLGLNLGTGKPESAVAFVEYCNLHKGTRWSDLRRSHGYEKPHNVRYWCLGNEMDGPWQQGALKAREYGQKARETAQQIHVIDDSVSLIACGSCNTELPTYLHWDIEVLEECYELVDGISLHNYFGNTTELTGQDSARYLAMNLDMERQIQEVAAVCDHVQHLLRSRKRLWLSFDEWNVWYRARTEDHMDGQQQFAPRLLEEVYNLEDALLVGGFLNTLLRQSARVRVGCLAQLVNVIAPLVTSEDGLLRQTIYYPYQWVLRYARGVVLDASLHCETYSIFADGLREDFARDDQVPYLDMAITYDAEQGQLTAFILNRDTTGARTLELNWQGKEPARVLACETLTGGDLKAENSFEDPQRVTPQNLAPPSVGARMSLELPAASYTLLHLAMDQD